jgi:hypothetical protein
MIKRHIFQNRFEFFWKNPHRANFPLWAEDRFSGDKPKLMHSAFFMQYSHSNFVQQKGMAYEYRRHCFFSTDGLSSHGRFPQMRFTIPRKRQGPEFFLSGPVPLHGICSTHFSGKPSGHRIVPSRNSKQALPHGNTRLYCAKYTCRCQRKSGLAYLRRFLTGIDPHGQIPLCSRRIQNRPGSNSLCIGFHNNRFVPFFVSLGKVSKAQRRNQVAYAHRFAR